MQTLALVIALLVGVAGLSACDRNTEAFVEGEKPRSPDLARIFPESDPSAARPGMPAAPPGQSAMPPAVPQRGAAPVVASASGEAETISGTIRVAPELERAVPGESTLFVIARAAGVRGGPPMAVLRVPNPGFPLEFEIGPQNVMIPSMRFEGDIEISARVDGDGNAMTRLPGDLSGSTREPSRPGTRGVEIVLDEKL